MAYYIRCTWKDHDFLRSTISGGKFFQRNTPGHRIGGSIELANNSAKNGIVNLSSPYPVGETLDRIETAAKNRGMLIFLRLDHRLEAEKVGLSMQPTQLLFVGNPKAGTGMMNTSASAAIDLPLKALAWEDHQGKVWLSYNSPGYLKQRHNLTDEQEKMLASFGSLLEDVVK